MSSVCFERIRERARLLCEQNGLDPDFMAYEGTDDLGYGIREPNWTLFKEEAESELNKENDRLR